MTRFSIEPPAPPSGVLDRSEDVREPARLADGWRSARVLPLGPGGAVPTRASAGGVRLAFDAASDWGVAPPPGAIMLGSFDGADHWTVPEWVSRRASPTGESSAGGPSFASLRTVGPLLSEADAALAMTAVALTGWHAATVFCSRCGRPTVPDLSGHSRLCAAGHQDFPRTDPAVIVLVHDDADHAVLARQPSWAPGRFSVLAGFAEAGESLEATVAREIGEEVGVAVDEVEYLGSQPWPFPRSLMIAFAARAPSGAELRPRPGEIAEARWFSRAELRALVTESGAAGDMAAGDTAGLAGAGAGGGAAGVSGGAGITLPGRMSIARRMVEGFVNAG